MKNSFRTEIHLDAFTESICYKDKILMLGSCFTENIGGKLDRSLFNIDINPFGILYNPISVRNSIEMLIDKRMFTDQDLFFDNEQWNSIYHHSRFSNSDMNSCLENINKRIIQSHDHLKAAGFLFITFGTSWVYELKDNKVVVSNCHRLHADKFERRLLKSETIIEHFSSVLTKLFDFNKKLKIIFTVSPVRHWKDGAVSNQRSKSNLIVAIHELINQFEDISYFPSYELVMDDLRDYRFFNQDMLHPNELAIDYIWDKFRSVFFDTHTKNLSDEILKLSKAAEHKPFNKSGKSYRDFLQSQIEKIALLKTRNTEINLDKIERIFIEEFKALKTK